MPTISAYPFSAAASLTRAKALLMLLAGSYGCEVMLFRLAIRYEKSSRVGGAYDFLKFLRGKDALTEVYL